MKNHEEQYFFEKKTNFWKWTDDVERKESMEVEGKNIILKTFKNIKDNYNKFICYGKHNKYVKELVQ